MIENHNYDAAALRKKEREAVKKRKSDEENLLKESKRNVKEATKKRKLDEDNEEKRSVKEESTLKCTLVYINVQFVHLSIH